ncbi:CDP-glycerol glycerophosphotransferase family protein [Demequina sp. NBRC 110055]|uniref:CDP-glycerol glycerophosphotransferase family protein n=1 Tax=Demequina sp. NBRC 110055 TaxID=1570344 RepID=UPI0013564E84|nr:CDP-glycerol glycerophosphotransferase family protein [Demequina sp. NBRC 110055]
MDDRALVVRGVYAGPLPSDFGLQGTEAHPSAPATAVGEGRFECRVPLHATGWMGKDRVLPAGTYVLTVSYPHGRDRLLVAPAAVRTTLPAHAQNAWLSVTVGRAALGTITVTIAAPLAPDEQGTSGRAAVTAIKHPTPVVKDALFLQSWFGKSFSDNPAPLAHALRDDARKIFVGVQDFSVEVPDHVTPVVVGSRAWWEAMTSSRVVVDNSWIPPQFKRRAGQKVVQTWHGTPLKKLGYDRSQHEGRPSTPQSFKWGSSKWDLLVSPNAYSTEILRRAYTYDGRIAEIGYPRNDVLVADGALRAKVRTSLGIGPDETVVLYAPTFREDARATSAFCDVHALGRALGSRYRLLVRGHSATVRSAARHRGRHVLDVTSYPESSHMLAIADVLITDYSSVMFDFTATGRPVVFFAPDMEDYADAGRGVYFDLADRAPGPVVRDESQLAGAVREAWVGRSQTSADYDEWTARFNTYDDGGATERLAAILREWF